MRNNQEINIANLKQYLLGNLPPQEAEAIDLQIISDESSEEKLLWAESELMEDYLDETLSPTDVELFKENFLVSRNAALNSDKFLWSETTRKTARRKMRRQKPLMRRRKVFTKN